MRTKSARHRRDIADVYHGYAVPASTLRRHVFKSETDTEVFAHLVASVRAKHPGMPLDAVVRLALHPVHGTFGLVFAFEDQPDLLIGARRGSPLIVGVGEGEYFLASDASAIVVSQRRWEAGVHSLASWPANARTHRRSTPRRWSTCTRMRWW